MPEDAEINVLKGYEKDNKDPKKLRDLEQLLLAMVQVPRVSAKITILRLKVLAEENLEAAENDVAPKH